MDQSENDIFNHHHHVREEKYVCRRGFRKKNTIIHDDGRCFDSILSKQVKQDEIFVFVIIVPFSYFLNVVFFQSIKKKFLSSLGKP